jgi:hypothetical protein
MTTKSIPPPTDPGKLIILTPDDSTVFDGGLATTFELWLERDLLNSTTKNMSPGFLYTFIIRQMGQGNYLFVWPATVQGGMTIDPRAGHVSTQTFIAIPGEDLRAIIPGASS